MLQKLAYRSEAEIHDDFSIQPLTQTMDDLLEEFRTHDVLKAVSDAGVLVGSVRTVVRDGTCYVGKLIVDPLHQNRGIGRALLSAVEGRNPDAERFELFTGHLSAKNLHLYHGLGYREFKREKAGEKVVLVFLEKRGAA